MGLQAFHRWLDRSTAAVAIWYDNLCRFECSKVGGLSGGGTYQPLSSLHRDKIEVLLYPCNSVLSFCGALSVPLLRPCHVATLRMCLTCGLSRVFSTTSKDEINETTFLHSCSGSCTGPGHEYELNLVLSGLMCDSRASNMQRALEAAGDTGGIYHLPVAHLCNMATALLGEAQVLAILVGCEQMPLDAGSPCQFPADSFVSSPRRALPPWKALACHCQAILVTPDMTQATPAAGTLAHEESQQTRMLALCVHV